MITNTGVQTQISTDLLTAMFLQFLGNLTVRIFQVTEQHSFVVFSITCFNTGRSTTFINTVYTHSAGLNSTLTTGRMFHWIFNGFMCE